MARVRRHHDPLPFQFVAFQSPSFWAPVFTFARASPLGGTTDDAGGDVMLCVAVCDEDHPSPTSAMAPHTAGWASNG